MSNSLYSKLLMAGLALLALWLFGRFLLPLIFPFLLGGALALLAEPTVRILHTRLKLPRSAAAGLGVSLTFGLLTLSLLFLGALLFRQLRALAGVLPDLGLMAKSGLSSLGAWLQGLTRYAPGSLREQLARRIGEFFSGGSDLLDKAVSHTLSLAGGMLTHVPDSALSFGTALLSSFMISAKLPALRRRLGSLLTGKRLQPLRNAWQRVRSALGGWVLAQTKLAGVTLGILTAGFLLLRIPFAVLWAFLTALVDIFPVLGTGTVLIPWSLICLLQEDRGRGIGLLGLYAVVALTRSVLEPKLVGRHLGLDPLVTLAALYAGYKIWGLPGMLLAPMLAVVVSRLFASAGPRPE